MKSSKITIQLTPGTVFEIKPKHKYLVIMPVDSDIKQIAPALSKFFEPTPVFVLAANDVSSIKIAELVEGKGE